MGEFNEILGGEAAGLPAVKRIVGGVRAAMVIALASTVLTGCFGSGSSGTLSSSIVQNDAPADEPADPADEPADPVDEPADPVDEPAAQTLDNAKVGDVDDDMISAAGLRSFATESFTALDEQDVSVTLTKTEDGYTLSYNGSDVAFTSADLIDGDYEKYATAGDTGSGEIATLYALGGFDAEHATTSEVLASPRVMVPLRFILQMNGSEISDGLTADSQVLGYTVVGYKTDPADMPTSGTATYIGTGEFAFYAINRGDTADDVNRLDLYGNTNMAVDFDAGTLGAILDITSTTTYTGDGASETVDVSDAGYAMEFGGAKISGSEISFVDNGEDSWGTGNEALDNYLAEGPLADGIGPEVSGSGSFYGANAESAALVLSGSSSTHVLQGVLWGDLQE